MRSDLGNALSFLTILPAQWLIRERDRAPGYMFSFFPVVGLIIGIIIAVVASTHVLSPDLTVFVTLAVWVALTGGLHLDGFADSSDGLLATVTPERRLEIMKDPRAGSWAVVGVVLLLLGKWVAIRSIGNPILLILPPMAGRWAMTLASAGFPNARPDGLGAHYRTGLGPTQVAMATLTMLILSILFGWKILIAFALPLAVVIFGGRWAAQRLGGGLTGDVYGAICEVVELLVLILLSAA